MGAGQDPSGGTTTDQSTGTAGIALAQGELVSCTFVVVEVAERTAQTIRRFMYRRADMLLNSEPDRSRMQRRVFANGAGPLPPITALVGEVASPFTVSAGGLGAGGASTIVVGSSLNQILAARDARSRNRMSLGANADAEVASLKDAQPATPRSDTDIWIEAHYHKFNEALDTDGQLGVLYIGGEYHFRPGALFGLLGQMDWSNQESDQPLSKVRGTGWMVGPYTTFKLTDRVLFDARVAWGKSSNEISPFLTYTDDFNTRRWLAKATSREITHTGPGDCRRRRASNTSMESPRATQTSMASPSPRKT